MESLIGQTDAMEMVERLNAEFDIVVDENNKLTEQNEILKEKLKLSESKKDKINEYYCRLDGPPSCSQCSDLIYYGQSYSEVSNSHHNLIELYCSDCLGDRINFPDGWTCKIIEAYD
tara:strand:+ start:241 stop:591 length:351 start_codon:yes stop_codon:yes gene_type:complete